ncbi:MBL fold metallo-hydrolase [Myxococcota bacterium]|nr:MBL fold metallo-hydrolase [Myxococcota bacterium]
MTRACTPVALLTLTLVTSACPAGRPPAAPEPTTTSTSTTAGAEVCTSRVGAPRVEEVGPGIFVAIGYDLANVILIQTPKGNVLVDAAMTPARASAAKAALLARAPGPIAALVLTHSHIDHVGGASALVDADTPIWATAAFTGHALKQYGLFQPTEARRGARQFGRHLAGTDPCSALGLRVDFDGVRETGMRFPTHTFSSSVALDFGRRIELYEAHGETDDHLFVWVPDARALMPGDNYYEAFPNLYTLRGTRPRPVSRWIASLDQMRRLAPEVLVPSHTRPVRGAADVEATLRDYRDAIQWVRDSVVRRTNAGEHVDDVVATIALPAHLASRPFLAELYGRVDWSARAIHGYELGWFDEDPEDVRPLPARTIAEREVAMMGGADVVTKAAIDAIARDPAWALHLLAKVRKSAGPSAARDAAMVRALEAHAAAQRNTNAKSYLLESAWELSHAPDPLPESKPDAVALAAIPLETFFTIMTSRLSADDSLDVHESVVFDFTDTGERFIVTVRRGVAELAVGAALPGTPDPVARVKVSSTTWKGLAIGTLSTPAALAKDLDVEDAIAFARFIQRFERRR